MFCLLVSQEKIYVEDPKKVFHEYFHYACYLKANGEATKSGKMEKFLFCDYVIARTNKNHNGYDICELYHLEGGLG